MLLKDAKDCDKIEEFGTIGSADRSHPCHRHYRRVEQVIVKIKYGQDMIKVHGLTYDPSVPPCEVRMQ